MYRLISTGSEDLSADLNLSRLSIGRDPSNDLVLPEEGVSGFHASIFFDNGRTEIVDQGSTNGTFVNGRPVQGRQELKPWDKVRFVGVEFEVVDPAGRKPTSVQAAVPAATTATAPESMPASAGPMLGTLVLAAGEGAPQNFEIRGNISVGRAAENALTLSAPTVSSRHADIVVCEGGVEVVDLGATNGTWVNGRRVSRQRLRHGDAVRFDTVEYRLELPGGASSRTQVNPAVGAGGAATMVNPAVKPEPAAFEPSPSLSGPSPGSPSQDSIATVDSEGPAFAEPSTARPDPVPSPKTAASPSTTPDPREAPVSASSRATQVEMSAPPKMAPPPKMSAPSAAQGEPSEAARAMEEGAERGFKWLFFSINGRLGRLKYFLSILGLAAVSFALISVVQTVMYGRISLDPNFYGYFPSTLPINLLMLWPGISLGVKRFHDQNRSGHWMWLLFVPLISIVPAIMLLFVRGTRGVNRFGEQPN